MGWPFSSNKSSDYKDIQVRQFVLSLATLYDKQIIKTFHYCERLEYNLYNYKNKTNSIFVDMNDDDNICLVCLSTLLGPCLKYNCRCGIMVHEGCMFRMILSGMCRCPQCNEVITKHPYKPYIASPASYSSEIILKELDNVIRGKSSAAAILAVESCGIHNIIEFDAHGFGAT